MVNPEHTFIDTSDQILIIMTRVCKQQLCQCSHRLPITPQHHRGMLIATNKPSQYQLVCAVMGYRPDYIRVHALLQTLSCAQSLIVVHCVLYSESFIIIIVFLPK